MKKSSLLWLCVTLLSGCQTAPKVVADLTEKLPARSADSVMVYMAADSVPAMAKKIGTVKVTDGGLTPTKDCLFPNMLALAVKKTAESGGNGFHIDEHRYPGFHGSTCHRIWGTMYLMPDSLITADTRSTLSDLEKYEEDVVLAKASQMITDIRDRRLNNPRNVVKVNLGPSWIISTLETPYRTYKSKLGFTFSADYQHIWRSGLGIGLNYEYFYATFDEGFNMHMHYIGPSIVGSVMLGQKWRWDTSLGVGFSHYRETIRDGYQKYRPASSLDGYQIHYPVYDASYSENGVGIMLQTGFEYLLSEHVGIGLHFNFTSVSLKKPEGKGDDYDFYGIRRFDPQLGIIWYL